MGANSLGLTITELPAANAGAIFLMAINMGWLKGCQNHRYSAMIEITITYSNLSNYAERNALNIVKQRSLGGCNIVLSCA